MKLGKDWGFNVRVRDVKENRIKFEDRKASEKEIENYEEGEIERQNNEWVISKGCKCNVGFTGGVVLDPFFGAGTTGLVALKQNKKFIGIELNKDYIEIAMKRLKPYLEQKKLFS
jgi:DNA modification methylase